MDGRRFDDAARALARPGNRRRLLAGCLAAATAAVGIAGARGGRTDAQSCPNEGEPCGIMVPCCPGLFCRTLLPANPNAGVCVIGSSPSSGGAGTGGNGDDDNPTAAPRTKATATPTATPAATSTPAATATATTTATPSPDDRDGRLAVRVDCLGPVETTEIENTGKVAVTIEKVRSLAAEYRGEAREISRDDRLEPGKSIRFQSGTEAKPGRERLATYPLYRDGAGGRVVAIETTAGTFQAACRGGSGGNGGKNGGGGPTARLEVTLACSGDLEETSIKNRGEEQVTIAQIRTLVRQDTFPLDQSLPGRKANEEGETIVFYSGPDAATMVNMISKSEIYVDDPKEGVEVTIKVGRESKPVKVGPVYCTPKRNQRR